MESNLITARPVKPAAAYIGGKRNLYRRLITIIEQTPHRSYVEPFVGMGGVFLRRPFRARSEVINDISADVANLLRILQRHYVPFMDMLRWQLTSRAEFDRLQRSNADCLTDLERAARFLYLQRLAFGGKVAGRTYGVSRGMPARFDVTKLEPLLADIHERLASVTIERLQYPELIRRYDAADTLFYLDPPYWGCERDYGDGVFHRDDFERLADQLASIRGRFILSINDTPGARQTFGRFVVEQVETTYTVAAGAAKRVGELIVTSHGS